MKVFLVRECWNYEGSLVVAVLATRAEAEEVVKRVRPTTTADEVDVEEWTLGEVRA